ncbi:MAG: hypothetical protein M3Q99_04195 [Acidobacteriota bacterium]|nr:hypothetical protein [Acidobacteriota bacterium]
MKILALISVLIFSLTLLFCSKFNNLADVFKKSSPKQILEITDDFTGLYWMNGKVVVFRLYDDKSAEYDEYPLNKTQYNAIQAKTVKNTKRIKINDAEFEEIVSVLTSDEFSKVERIIKPQKSCIDAFINTEINFNFNNLKKQFVIKNHCSTLADAKSTNFSFNNFPSKMNAFFEKITKIKNKESAGKFYN